MNARARSAFTLVELLVVVTIIGILLAMLFTSMGGIWENLNLFRCSDNLRLIWQAYCTRAADERMNTAGPMTAMKWQPNLAPYVEQQGAIFYCPERDAAGKDSGDPDHPPQKVTPRRLRVWSDPMGSSPDGRAGGLPPAWMCWDDLNVWQENAKNSGVWVRNVTPDKQYELYFEDSWQNNTWNDLELRFTARPDGDVEVEYFGQHTGAYHYWLRDADTDEDIMPPGYMGFGATLPIGTKAVIGRVEGSTNYGMNSLMKGDESFAAGNRVILCIDYVRTIARGPTDREPDDWRGPDWETPDHILLFARHGKKANVLWSDGTVELVDPRDLDPINVRTVEHFWDPQGRRE